MLSVKFKLWVRAAAGLPTNKAHNLLNNKKECECLLILIFVLMLMLRMVAGRCVRLDTDLLLVTTQTQTSPPSVSTSGRDSQSRTTSEHHFSRFLHFFVELLENCPSMASQMYGLGTWWMIVKRCQWRCYHVSRLISRQISFKTNTSHFLLKISTSADQRRSDLDHDLISSRLQISARYGTFAGQLMSMEKHFMCFFRIRNIFAFIHKLSLYRKNI